MVVKIAGNKPERVQSIFSIEGQEKAIAFSGFFAGD